MRLPPIATALLLVAPFWIGTYLVAGWAGVGTMLMLCGIAELLLFALPVWLARVRRERAARRRTGTRADEVVGEI